MGTVFTEGRRPAEFIISEGPHCYSRDVVSVAAGAKLDPGTVVGMVTATGLVTALNPATDPADGSETAYGVLMYPALAADAAVKVTAIVRDAQVNSRTLAWPEGITAEQKAAAVTALAARGIIVR